MSKYPDGRDFSIVSQPHHDIHAGMTDPSDLSDIFLVIEAPPEPRHAARSTLTT
ncbi:hypothetical protein [Methylobacterium sp. ID0610]|uniref:hypothetical protein n=1 Tax=Methylobacterium carpenticola TaxID=3344827 RepID=UPI0036A37116